MLLSREMVLLCLPPPPQFTLASVSLGGCKLLGGLEHCLWGCVLVRHLHMVGIQYMTEPLNPPGQ